MENSFAEIETKDSLFTSTRNACKLCAPLGASLAFRGIDGCIPLIHGSQGCSTYIRRYCISHFREPLDIASSNFVESTAIFGGKDNLFTALDNVSRSYKPRAIGITSTCLSETIGENVPLYLKQYFDERDRGERNNNGQNPLIFYASTPSYRGTHMNGFHEAVLQTVKTLNNPGYASKIKQAHINILSGFISAEDIRELHRIVASFVRDCHGTYTLLPDYSESLDGPSWETYQKLPAGGTKIEDIKKMGSAAGTIFFGGETVKNAGAWLEENFFVPLTAMHLPIGIQNSDAFMSALGSITCRETPEEFTKERGRLVDAYIDGHKYVNGKRAIIYGEDDLTAALTAFLAEIGVKVALKGGPDADFATMLEEAGELEPDFIMGNSKGLYLSRSLGIPLVRCGFPIHDRIGGQRILHLGYRGTLNLFDMICNALLEAKQDSHERGYTYL